MSISTCNARYTQCNCGVFSYLNTTKTTPVFVCRYTICLEEHGRNLRKTPCFAHRERFAPIIHVMFLLCGEIIYGTGDISPVAFTILELMVDFKRLLAECPELLHPLLKWLATLGNAINGSGSSVCFF